MIDIEEFKPLIIERLMPLKPDGTMKKLTDVSKLHGVGRKHEVELESGIKRCMSGMVSNASISVGLCD